MRYAIFYRDVQRLGFSMPSWVKKTQVDRSEYIEVTTIDVEDLEAVFDAMNCDSGSELVTKLRCRSMMSGDVAVDRNGTVYYCASAGWERVTWT